MFSLTKHTRHHAARHLHQLKSLARNPLALVAAVMLLALAASFVHVLHEAVVTGERTRQTWRATEAERLEARSKTRGLPIKSARMP